MGPLTGIKVIEIANGIHGPYAAMLLGDMGADVLKIEPPVGDLNRAVDIIDGLPFGSQFYSCNRNKQAMCLDLRQPEGRDIALKLLDTADVLIENARPGVLDRLGLGYDAVSARNSRLVYASATGYGPRGPRAGQPSLDIVGQAAGGVASHTGTEETGPLPAGSAIADHAGALWLAYGVALALYGREQTGRGQKVDSSLLGSLIGLQAWELSRFLHRRDEPPLGGKGHPHARGAWRFFATADGNIALAGVTDPRWEGLCRALGREDWFEDPRFSTSDARLAHTDDLVVEMERTIATLPTDPLLDRLAAEDQIASRVSNYTDLAADPQVLENAYLTEYESEGYGRLPAVGIPVQLSDTPGVIRRQPPLMDEHTATVLESLGYDWDQIGDLFARGVAGAAGRTEA